LERERASKAKLQKELQETKKDIIFGGVGDVVLVQLRTVSCENVSF
jgi:hypothetical protein